MGSCRTPKRLRRGSSAQPSFHPDSLASPFRCHAIMPRSRCPHSLWPQVVRVARGNGWVKRFLWQG